MGMPPNMIINAPLYVQKKFSAKCTDYVDPSQAKSSPLNGVFGQNVKIEDVIGWIYNVLTILDAKASALMRLNGVLIAAAVFFLGLFGREDSILSRTNFEAILIIFCALLSAISMILCLFVVNVKWRFLEKATIDAQHICSFTNEIISLDKESMRRQKFYQNAWRVSLVASVGFFGEFIWQTICVGSNVL